MTALLIGLRSAVIIFNLAMLMTYARVKLPDAVGDRLGAYGWISISIGMVFFASPNHVAELLHHPFPPTLHDFLVIGLMLCLLTGSIFWAAARGYRRGGTTRDVKRGVCMNLVVIASCIAVAAIAR